MKVFISTGGTSEPIDDVRVVTNGSTGRFGLDLAAAASAAGAEVTLAASALAAAHAMSHPGLSSVQVSRFHTVDDLASLYAAGAAWADEPEAPVVFAAAAVSDFRPVRAVGKLSSKEDLVVRFERTPKLVDGLRATWGRRPFLIGFKLTSGAEPAHTFAEARDLLFRAKLDMVIANDLSELHDGQHPCWVVTPEGGTIRFEGPRAEVASRLWAFVAARRAVTWSHTTQTSSPDPASPVSRRRWARALGFAQDASLLPDTSGNVVTRAGYPGDRVALVVASPRAVDKSLLVPADGIAVRVDPASTELLCFSDRRASIDTAAYGRMLADLGDVDTLIHFHDGWGRPQATSSFPYACGAAEEASAVRTTLGPREKDQAWLIELVHHGFLLGLSDAEFDRIEAEWETAKLEWEEHLNIIGEHPEASRVRPVWEGPRIVGVLADAEAPTADGVVSGVALYLNESCRGTGLGKVLAHQLHARHQPVLTIPACAVVDWWAAHGFAPREVAPGILFCAPEPVVLADDAPV